MVRTQLYILHRIVHWVYNYMFRPYILAIIRLYCMGYPTHVLYSCYLSLQYNPTMANIQGRNMQLYTQCTILCEISSCVLTIQVTHIFGLYDSENKVYTQLYNLCILCVTQHLHLSKKFCVQLNCAYILEDRIQFGSRNNRCL